MSSFTGASGSTLNKVYERLRKRSYRRRVLGQRFAGGDTFRRIGHSLYVEGVKDALAEFDRERS